MVDRYQNKGFNKILNKARAEKILEKLQDGRECLEVGAGEGQITKYLLSKFRHVSAIEPNMDGLAIRHKNLIRIEDVLEDIEPYCTFDSIVCTNVLEHTVVPEDFLKALKEWGNDETTFFISVPNARSYNRLLGVDTGFLKTPEEVSKQDIDAGHYRMYNIETLRKEIEGAGFKIIESGSMIYKPFPNSIMDKIPNQIIKKCLNFEMVGNGAELYVVCSL